jgi:hypothetical protein
MQLRTLPGQNLDGSPDYFVVFSVGLTSTSWVLRDELGVHTFKNTEEFFKALGGRVAWNRWDDESREWILGMNQGKPIG